MEWPNVKIYSRRMPESEDKGSARQEAWIKGMNKSYCTIELLSGEALFFNNVARFIACCSGWTR
jgi:hypothetical protein